MEQADTSQSLQESERPESVRISELEQQDAQADTPDQSILSVSLLG